MVSGTVGSRQPPPPARLQRAPPLAPTRAPCRQRRPLENHVVACSSPSHPTTRRCGRYSFVADVLGDERVSSAQVAIGLPKQVATRTGARTVYVLPLLAAGGGSFAE